MQVDCEQVQRMATHIAFFIPHLLYFTIIVVVIVHSIGRESKSIEYSGHCFTNSQVVLYLRILHSNVLQIFSGMVLDWLQYASELAASSFLLSVIRQFCLFTCNVFHDQDLKC